MTFGLLVLGLKVFQEAGRETEDTLFLLIINRIVYRMCNIFYYKYLIMDNTFIIISCN